VDVVLRCGQCGLPWAKICNGVLVVESRHHGDRHVNAMALEALMRLWAEAQVEEDRRKAEAQDN
jgi:hypothetical protein